ncbi:hypothetical protein ABDD95_07005 [Mucilaginibacter sp. PAMB04274]|uniref:hypothetical protein n=1 Tax=Mucilaginibacter sp. PAMB04274 TaxID=3138568 RepID=UPI0031F6FA34
MIARNAPFVAECKVTTGSGIFTCAPAVIDNIATLSNSFKAAGTGITNGVQQTGTIGSGSNQA